MKHGECSLGLPEIRILEPSADSRTLGVVYAGRTEDERADDVILFAINVFWEPQTLRLPDGRCWRVEIDTEQEDGGKAGQHTVRGEVRLAPRSMQVLVLCGE